MASTFSVQHIGIAGIFCLTLAAPGAARGQWVDDFDSYATDTLLSGQGGWTTWNDNGAINADVSGDFSYSGPNSLRLHPDSDMVMRFQGYSGGTWAVRAMTYIPSGHTGESWFILLNTYAPNGTQVWSTQVVFVGDVVTSAGGTNFGGTGFLPLVFDAWVELAVEIDFDANVQVILYGGKMLDATPWQMGGLSEIQAIDIFSNNGSYAYFDDVSVQPEEFPPKGFRTALVSEKCPGPDPIQVTIRQEVPSGADPKEEVTVTEVVSGDLGAAQVKAANGGTAADRPATSISPEGYISSWLLLGPFDGNFGGNNPGCPEMERDWLTDGMSTFETNLQPEAGQTVATDLDRKSVV
jgi:hypothetical protein